MTAELKKYVEDYIDGDPIIAFGLQRGLVSSRILTKHILNEHKQLKGKFETVRNTVRKYADEAIPKVNVKTVFNSFKDSYVDIRSNLVSVKIARKVGIKQVLTLVDELNLTNENFIRLMNNEIAFHLIIQKKDEEKIVKPLRNDILEIADKIASITIHLNPVVKDTPGIYFILLGQVALQQINIFDVSSYGSELSIYVQQKDASATHRVLHEMCEYQKKFCD